MTDQERIANLEKQVAHLSQLLERALDSIENHVHRQIDEYQSGINGITGVPQRWDGSSFGIPSIQPFEFPGKETWTMKIQVTMKTPSALFDSIVDAAREEVRGMEGLDPSEKEMLVDERVDEALTKAKKYFKYDEILTEEFDTEAMTCTVLPAKG